LDRIDIHVEVPRLSKEESEKLLSRESVDSECSASVRKQVMMARNIQNQRAGKCNAQLSQREIQQVCQLANEDEAYLKKAVLHWNLSVSSFYRILKMARTVADLDSAGSITRGHLQEAMGYRYRGEG
jgi:magnesium chelatase family protein